MRFLANRTDQRLDGRTRKIGPISRKSSYEFQDKSGFTFFRFKTFRLAVHTVELRHFNSPLIHALRYCHERENPAALLGFLEDDEAQRVVRLAGCPAISDLENVEKITARQ